jgi:hypothetical protein
MSIEAVITQEAPNPMPDVFPQAVTANGMVFCSGSIAMDPTTCKIIDGDIQAHTVCCTIYPISRELLAFTGHSLRTSANPECDRYVASSHQEPIGRFARGGFKPYEGGQDQHFPLEHGRFPIDERSIRPVLRAPQALPHVSLA